MIRSMTGYGASSADGADLRAAVSVKSVNHRYLEIGLSLSRRLAPLEAEVKGVVQSRLQRGKVEVAVRASFPDDGGGQVVASPRLVAGLVSALRQIQGDHRLGGDVSIADVARFPGVLEVVDPPAVLDEAARRAVLGLVGQALSDLEGMRSSEGARLSEELLGRLSAIAEAADRIEALSEEGRSARRTALLERVRSTVEEVGLDDARLYQEVVRLVDRADVAEEIQRLRSHVVLARELMGRPEASGKRLDFLAQELMREANTIGSKAASAPMIAEVVALKSDVERFREQVQNVE
ncbi:MAG: YicC/YloC family endoribonuclease [Vicinamibacteria bacterium]